MKPFKSFITESRDVEITKMTDTKLDKISSDMSKGGAAEGKDYEIVNKGKKMFVRLNTPKAEKAASKIKF